MPHQILFKTDKFFGTIDDTIIRICFNNLIIYVINTNNPKYNSEWQYGSDVETVSRCVTVPLPADFSIDIVEQLLSEQFSISMTSLSLAYTDGTYHAPFCTW